MNRSIADILENVTPTPAAYLSAARRLRALAESDLRRVGVFVLSSYTADPLEPYLVVEGARRGMLFEPSFGPFNQIEPLVFDPQGPLYAARPDVIFILTQLEDIAPRLAHALAGLSTEEVEAELRLLFERFEGLAAGLRRNAGATILIGNIAEPIVRAAGLADPLLPVSQSDVARRINRSLADLCRRQAGMYIFDYDRLVQEFGITRWHDARLGYWGRVPFGAEAQIACGRRMARYVRALYFPPCKCLALDLDNTLWGGVLGEDSPSGIRLGEDYPGNVFKAFQRRLRALREQGVLLAVASKNNPQEALDALSGHPDMLLRPDDFAAMEIHWGDKAASLRAIADRLNIGIDSIAFFDDDPVEREWVRSCLPQVTVIDAPKDPADYIRALDDSEAFDRLTLSDEDLRRGAMLAETEKRREWREQSATLEDFLRGLRMVVTVGRVGPDTLERVAQLIQKTNQFNLTARRRTAAEIDEMIGSGAVALWARVRDRFGDSGLTGVALALPRGDGSWLIDTFLLSCRVLGRRVEAALLAALAGCVARRGGALLTGEHIPTGRNDVASDFFPAHGFAPAPGEPGRWSFDLRAGLVAAPDFIEIEKEGPDL